MLRSPKARLAGIGWAVLALCWLGVSLQLFSRFDHFAPNAEVYEDLSGPLPVEVQEEAHCTAGARVSTCTALRLSNRSTQSSFGHAHSRITHRMDVVLLWSCTNGDQLRLTLRAPFLVEHAHLDLLEAHIADLAWQMPVMDWLRLRRAPASHQTNFLMDAQTTKPDLVLSDMITSPVMDRRTGPGFIALGYPAIDAEYIARHLECQNP